MKQVFDVLDGPTRGPNLNSGPVGILLATCQELQVVDFPVIEIPADYIADLVNNNDLSSDQKYLRDIIIGISSGEISESLSKRSPGKVGYARWLSTANRALRVYVSQLTPTNDFIVIVKYIILVYALTWFSIKVQPTFYDSPRLIHAMVIAERQLNDNRINTIMSEKLKSNLY